MDETTYEKELNYQGELNRQRRQVQNTRKINYLRQKTRGGLEQKAKKIAKKQVKRAVLSWVMTIAASILFNPLTWIILVIALAAFCAATLVVASIEAGEYYLTHPWEIVVDPAEWVGGMLKFW